MSKYFTFLCLLAVVFVSNSLSSQITNGRSRYKRSAQVFDVKFGVALGFDRSWLKGDVYVVRPNSMGAGFESFTKFKGRYAIHGGIYLDFKFTEKDFAQLDIKWANRGWKQENPYNFSPYVSNLDSVNIANKVEVKYNITYIEIPLRYKLRLSKEFFVLGGPFVGLNLSEVYKTSDDFGVDFPESSETTSHYVQLNYGLNVGFMFQLENGINFSAEYQHGFADINDYGGIRDITIPKNHLVSGSLSVGYTIAYFSRLTNHRKRRKGIL